MTTPMNFDQYDVLRYCGVPKRSIEFLRMYGDKMLANGLNKDPDQSIFYYGKTGSGKSTWAALTLLESLKRYRPIDRLITLCELYYFENPHFKFPVLGPIPSHLFVNVPDLLIKIRQTYDHVGDFTEAQLVDRCTDARWLVLDDLGAERSTEWVMQVLYLIVSKRYDDMKTTVFTTNYTIDDLEEKFQDSRLVSRIAHMCEFVKMKPTNYRKED